MDVKDSINKLQETELNPLFVLSSQERSRLSPIVEACLQIAEEAHKGDDPLSKKHVKIEYIHHPIAAMKILQACGVKDDLTLCAALLHDTLEQGKYAYKMTDHEVEHLGEKEAFEAAMYRASHTLADDISKNVAASLSQQYDYSDNRSSYLANTIASLIAEVVVQLTNPPWTKQIIDQDNGTQLELEHKRFVQVKHSNAYTIRAQRVKLADFASTLVGDYLYETDRSPYKLRDIYGRMLTVIKPFEDVRPELADFVRRFARKNDAILKGKEQRISAEEAASFDIKDHIDKSLAKKRDKLVWIDEENDALRDARQGIVSVGINAETRKVETFRVIEDSTRKGHEVGLSPLVNHIRSEVVNRMANGTEYEVEVGAASVYRRKETSGAPAIQITKKVRLEPAMDLDTFIRRGYGPKRSESAISEELTAKLQERLMSDQNAEVRRTTVDGITPKSEDNEAPASKVHCLSIVPDKHDLPVAALSMAS